MLCFFFWKKDLIYGFLFCLQELEIKKPQIRSPLSEKIDLDEYRIPRSPLGFNSSTYKSSSVLPPLKFYSGLVGPHNAVNLRVGSDDEGECEDEDDDGVDSGSNDFEGNSYEEEDLEKSVGCKSGGSTLNRGVLLENLRIQLPEDVMGFGGRGSWSAISGSSYGMRESLPFHSAYVRIMTLEEMHLFFVVLIVVSEII